MNQICAKIYYLISTGEVLAITSEMQGTVGSTTKEQDMEVYPQLKDKNPDEIDFIELEYGTLATTFTNVKSYSVDVQNKKLNLVYYTQEEIDVQKKQYEQRVQDTQETNSRISAISNYASQNVISIDDLENAIIQLELTKIQNGDV